MAESNVVKDRKCKTCGVNFSTDAKGIIKHAAGCK